MEICLKMDDEPVGSVLEGRPTCVGVVPGVCYSPPDQEEEADEAFLRQLEEVLCSQTLVLLGDSNQPNTC